ncbi:hypothetical protein [Pinibacter aurantiacus]|uniref:Type IX secretion system membrane protein PorP/SprF n=1 Tax=Pinibacter aurantiacus TaxID=2851599 RepID=A0A9E2S497_9BACT|nr:hypothetical protein [Pinibacter aurantiacus]MBV4355611.1 hypothetical protein [Pinibacter aurantiacus]
MPNSTIAKIASLKSIMVVLTMLTSTAATSQKEEVKYTSQFNFGCTLNLNYSKGQQFAGVKLFGGFNVTGVYKSTWVFNYGPSIAIYTKSLGANTNPLVNDIQLDFANSFGVGVCGGSDLSYIKYFRTINNASYYNVGVQKSFVGLMSANFIVNNHHRNQTVGSISLSFPGVTINYANDGAFPFNYVPLADNFDRWWTGGLGIYFHNRQSYNTVEFNFDQFTGYEPLLYEMSSMLGINVPRYIPEDSSVNRKKERYGSYNSSSYNLKIYFTKGYAVDIGVLGCLVGRGGTPFGLQDIIHTLGGYALHPNTDPTKIYLGATFNNLSNVYFKK